MTIEKNMKKLPKILTMLIIAVAIFGMTVFAVGFMTGCDSDGNNNRNDDRNNFSVDFENQAATFRNEGFTVTGPTTSRGTTSLLAVNLEGEQIFIWHYSDSSMANSGWDTAGAYIAGTNMTRHRNGLYIWYGTTGAIAVFEGRASDGGTSGGGSGGGTGGGTGGDTGDGTGGGAQTPNPTAVAVSVVGGGVPTIDLGAIIPIPLGLIAAVQPITANPAVTWSNSNNSVATIATSGLGVLVTGVSGGTTVVTATGQERVAGSITITVIAAPVDYRPSNIRIEEDAVFSWVLRWNASSPVGQYDVEIRNNRTGQTSEMRQSGTTFPMGLIGNIEPDVLFSLRVRAVVSLPADTTNWSSAVNFGMSAPELPTEIAAVYGNILNEVKLPSGWTWDFPNSLVGDANQIVIFDATYLRDGGWIPFRLPLVFMVGRATPIVETPPAALTTTGQFLRDIILPQGWTWNTPNASVGVAGARTFNATYSRQNNNWNTVTRAVSISVTNLPTPTAIFGQTLAEVSLLSGWEWNAPLNTAVGNFGSRVHSATYAREGFEPITRNISINVQRANPEYVVPTNITAVFGQTLSQAAAQLPVGWGWVAFGTTLVGNAGNRTHNAIFDTGNDNFNTVTRSIVINVARAESNPIVPVDIEGMTGQALSTVRLPQRWSWNEPNTITVSGERSFIAIYTPTDIANFYPVTRYVAVRILRSDEFWYISGTSQFNLAIDGAGRVWSWGTNSSGQLGHGDTVTRSVPTLIPNFSGITAVATGNSHSMAIDVYGRIWTWCSGSGGRLGHGDTYNRLVPTVLESMN